jgi:hypothetical protein
MHDKMNVNDNMRMKTKGSVLRSSGRLRPTWQLGKGQKGVEAARVGPALCTGAAANGDPSSARCRGPGLPGPYCCSPGGDQGQGRGAAASRTGRHLRRTLPDPGAGRRMPVSRSYYQLPSSRHVPRRFALAPSVPTDTGIQPPHRGGRRTDAFVRGEIWVRAVVLPNSNFF